MFSSRDSNVRFMLNWHHQGSANVPKAANEMKFLYLTALIALTIVSWGVYGPLLYEGQLLMGGPLEPSIYWPLICVGMTYFLIAVVISVVLLWIHGDQGHWSAGGVFWSFLAGTVSAVGTLCVILAFKFFGNPVYVMPLVFGLAPVASTFVTMWMTKNLKKGGAIFFAGVIIVAVGSSGVLVFKPTADNVEISEPPDGSITVVQTTISADGKDKDTIERSASSLQELKAEKFNVYKLYLHYKGATFFQFVMVILFILFAALCWGSYGPILYKGQAKMDGSRLRPLFCVGMAYLVLAIVIPSLVLASKQVTEQWTFFGSVWPLAAGIASVVGSLGILLAFHFGGRPTVVMSLVFGGAPVINVSLSVLLDGTTSGVSTTFLTAMVLLIAGSVVVLVFAPKQAKTPDPEKEKSPESSSRDSEKEKSPEASSTDSEKEKSPEASSTNSEKSDSQEASKTDPES